MRSSQWNQGEEDKLDTPVEESGDDKEAAAGRGGTTSTSTSSTQVDEREGVALVAVAAGAPSSSSGAVDEDEDEDSVTALEESISKKDREAYESEKEDVELAAEGFFSSYPGSPDYINETAPGSPQEISAAEGLETTRDDGSGGSASSSSDEGFEFPSISNFQQECGSGTCDREMEDGLEILVRRVYPVFDRELFRFYMEQAIREQQRWGTAVVLGVGKGQETRMKKPGPRMPLGRLMLEEEWQPSTSSSDADELEGLPPESYCLWTPGAGGSPAPQSPRGMPRRKSKSTGVASGRRRWRLKDLVIGRSHSDGKKKFLYLATDEGAAGEGKESCEKGKKFELVTIKKGAEVSAQELVAAHQRMKYSTASPEADRCSSIPPPPHPPTAPPQRQKDILLGLFANVNGATRSLLHPF